MNNQLVRNEQARTALAECQRVDEVKDIRDKAEAMAAYARQAKDTELIQFATEIKVRAERRCGELLRTSAERGERQSVGNPQLSNASTIAPTLAVLGITRDQSSRYQQLAAMPDEHFETAVATAKDTAGEVTTAFMLREAKRSKPQGRPKVGPKVEAIRQELKKAAKNRGTSMLCSYARLLLDAIAASDGFTEDEIDLLSQIDRAIHSTRSPCHEN